MTYLPRIYQDFTERFPDVAEAQGRLARAVREQSPFDEKTERLLTFALAVGAEADGAVRSNVRKAMAHGATPEELRAVALHAITTCGFPTAVAALRWIDEVLSAEGGDDDGPDPGQP
ncbi:carboxymuconolactone decarboxylase family protein [Blastococcus sp. SYSU DS1024]